MYKIELTAAEKAKRDSILKLLIRSYGGNGNRRYGVIR